MISSADLIVSKKVFAKDQVRLALDAANIALAQGFDSQAAQKKAIDCLRKAAEHVEAVYKESYFALAKQASEAQRDFYYDFPELHVWKDKHVNTANGLYPDHADLTEIMTQLVKMRAALKLVPIVKAPTKADVKAVALNAPVGSQNKDALRRALNDVRNELVELYAQHAQAKIDKHKTALAAAAWNITAAFKLKEDVQLAYRLFKIENAAGDCKPSPELELRHIDSFKRMAQDEFDGFIDKMILKLGSKLIVNVRYRGAIWQNCSISVKFEDGSSAQLVTKVIINTSKNGKLFNQWPTRITTS